MLGKQRVADLFVITWIASIAIITIYCYLVGNFNAACSFCDLGTSVAAPPF